MSKNDMKADIKKVGGSLVVNGDELLNAADITTHAVSDSEADEIIGLFASSRELLRALQASADDINFLGGDSGKYRALIAKATGEQA